MSSRQRELITALAEGTLEDETEARALIERSPRLRSHYEEQKRALEALASIPAAALSESEATDLRRDIWTAFTTTEPALVRRSRSQWAWGYAAVFLFAAIGLVAVLNETPWGADTDMTGSPETTQSASGIPPASEAAPDSAQRSLRLAAIVDRAKEDNMDFQTLTAGSSDAVEANWARCAAEARTDDYQILGTIEDEGSLLAVARLMTHFDPERKTYLVVDLKTCEIAYSDD